MTLAKERAKKATKTKRLPKSLQQRERLLDSIDLVQRLHTAAVARRGIAHASNIGIESDRLATRARGATLAGLSSVAREVRRNERQMAADFAAAARGTPRRNVAFPTPTGSMTEAPQTPNLPPFQHGMPGTPVSELLARRRFVVT
jgi:hypothetical protein